MALDKNGNVWAWGNNRYGQLGNGVFSASSNVPVQVMKPGDVPLTGIISIDAGFFHSLAVDEEGNVWVWGANDFGQLGLGYITYLGEKYAKSMP